MPKKLTFKEVKEFYEINGCTLLENEYINSKVNMKFTCKCGKDCSKKYNVFKQSPMCRECSAVIDKSHKTKRKNRTIEEVKYIFEKEGCILLEDEFINVKTLMKYICQCGNTSKISLSKFLIGRRCKDCGKEKLKDYWLQPYEEVKEFYENEGWTLLTTKENYINSFQRLDCICEKGHSCKSDFASFKDGVRCLECTGKLKLSFDYVKQYFEDNDCELLSEEYINAHEKLEYKCSCGNISYINFNNFSNGKRCGSCLVGKSKGEKRIEDYLINNNNIKHIFQYRMDDCRYKKPLPFDFAIFNNDELISLIEFDGKQHYEPFSFGGEKNEGEIIKEFKLLQHKDNIKTNYCLSNNIKLIRIPYWEFDNIESILDKEFNEILNNNIKESIAN